MKFSSFFSPFGQETTFEFRRPRIPLSGRAPPFVLMNQLSQFSSEVPRLQAVLFPYNALLAQSSSEMQSWDIPSTPGSYEEGAVDCVERMTQIKLQRKAFQVMLQGVNPLAAKSRLQLKGGQDQFLEIVMEFIIDKYFGFFKFMAYASLLWVESAVVN